MLFKEIIRVYAEKHAKKYEMQELLNATAAGIYNYHMS
jgi:hypothetical protein